VRARGLVAALVLALVSGCATTSGGDPRDPFEGFNRAHVLLQRWPGHGRRQPVSTVYKAITPDPVRTWVRNFFANIEDVFIGVNNMLQGKFVDGWTDWVRFRVQHDARRGRHQRRGERDGSREAQRGLRPDLRPWGIGSGPYLVLPLFGPSSVRDFGGLWLDWTADPLWYYTRPIALRNSLAFLRGVSRRTDLLDASRILEEAALDKYVFQRDAYLQRRRALIHDGKPPRDASSRLREEPAADAPASRRAPCRGRAQPLRRRPIRSSKCRPSNRRP
jgi:phospholipid-binding lipoprotein MlaA